MKIEHVAVWTTQLEVLKDFYVRHFGGEAGARYENPAKGFRSYFVRFASGARLELMQSEAVRQAGTDRERLGYAHLAVSVGSEAAVRTLTERLRQEGVPVAGEPRWTGDGYFESVVLDPDGNRIEITI